MIENIKPLDEGEEFVSIDEALEHIDNYKPRKEILEGSKPTDQLGDIIGMELRAEYEFDDVPAGIAFHPLERRAFQDLPARELAVACKDYVHFLDFILPSSLEPNSDVSAPGIRDVSYSPNGNLLAAGYEDKLSILKPTLVDLGEIATKLLLDTLLCVEYSRTEEDVIFVAYENGIITRHDLFADQQKISHVSHIGGYVFPDLSSFSRVGDVLAISYDNKVEIQEVTHVSSGEEKTEKLMEEKSIFGNVSSVALSDDRRIAVASDGGVFLFKPDYEHRELGSLLGVASHPNPVKHVAFSKDGKYLATTAYKTLRVFEVTHD